MHGKRLVYTFKVKITDKVKKLSELLALHDTNEFGQYLVIKYIYPMGQLKTLDLDKSFCDQNIPHDAQFVMLGQKNFTWDINCKGTSIQVSLK